MKKSFVFLSLFLIGFVILSIATLTPQRSAYAACVDPTTKKTIPCPNNNPGKSDYSKKNQATDVPPTNTPVPAPTDTPKPANTGLVISQAACPNPLLTNGSSPTQPTSGSPSFPWFLGGGGLILGLVVGFFTGGVRGERSVNGDGIVGPDRGWNGPITTPGELLPAVQKADKFDKWDKANAGISSGGDRSINGDGKPAGFDVFHKGKDAGFADGSVHPAMGDGSVHPSLDEAGAQVDMFQKGKDAGFADGSVHPSNQNAATGPGGGAGITDGISHSALSGNNTIPGSGETPQGNAGMEELH